MNRKDLMIASAAAAILALGCYQFVWSSQTTAAATASDDAAAAQASVTKLKGQVATLKHTESELAGKADLAAQMAQAVPVTADVSALLKLLQTKAHEHDVTLTSLTNGQLAAASKSGSSATTADPAAASDTANELMVTLAFHGTYTDVVSFINELGTLPRLLVVDSVSLTPLNSAAEPGKPVTAGDVSASVITRAFTTAELPVAPGASTTVAASGGATTSSTAKTAAGASATPVP